MNPNADRTNQQWIADLTGDPVTQSQALQDLRDRLQRGIFYYLSQERSDLAHLGFQDLTQMAEDMAQDATLRVMENLNSFRGDSRFTTWATKIAVRVAISDLRRARYKDFRLDDLTTDDGAFLAGAAVAQKNPLPNPENAAEQADVLDKITLAMREALTDRQRTAIQAVAVQGVPLEIVAEKMKTNRNALYKLLYDARQKLRQHLEAQGLPIAYMVDLFED
jgi:RNA polymerase sigma-70 factor (ECF subfamily)